MGASAMSRSFAATAMSRRSQSAIVAPEGSAGSAMRDGDPTSMSRLVRNGCGGVGAIAAWESGCNMRPLRMRHTAQRGGRGGRIAGGRFAHRAWWLRHRRVLYRRRKHVGTWRGGTRVARWHHVRLVCALRVHRRVTRVGQRQVGAVLHPVDARPRRHARQPLLSYSIVGMGLRGIGPEAARNGYHARANQCPGLLAATAHDQTPSVLNCPPPALHHPCVSAPTWS